ncbi:DUF883 family protein [Oceaniglobus roseus]|uniref:DUF883 family protein n=1 Tax=Oceaniglobus roseus TaxID=1737570 RepID=UPI000C7F6FA9|nr:DUF883 family protein [Kandeliimicrobium roseum]
MATIKEQTTEDLARQIEQLKADIGSLTKTITDLGKSSGSDFARTAREKAAAAREAGEDQVAYLQRQARDSLTEAETYVRTNPGTALGIAAGIGFLIGLLGSRR